MMAGGQESGQEARLAVGWWDSCGGVPPLFSQREIIAILAPSGDQAGSEASEFDSCVSFVPSECMSRGQALKIKKEKAVIFP